MFGAVRVCRACVTLSASPLYGHSGMGEAMRMGPVRVGTALVAAALLWAMGPLAHAETIKIGIVNSYSGFVAQAADEMQKGIDLYVKLHEKELPDGIKVELIKRDDTSNPEVGKRLAQELITRDQVRSWPGSSCRRSRRRWRR